MLAKKDDPNILSFEKMLNVDIKDKLKKFKPFKAMAEDTDYYDRVKTKKVSLIKWIFQALSCKCLYITNLRDMKPVYSKIDNIIKNKIKK